MMYRVGSGRLWGLLSVAMLSFVLLPVLPASAGQSYQDADELTVTPAQRQEIKFISTMLREGHYLKPKLDAELTERVLERFLDRLDHYRRYFRAEDIHQIESDWHGKIIKDFYELEPVYATHALYAKRWQERYDFAITLIDEAAPMMSGASNTDWPASAKAQDALWQTIVAQDLWRLTQAGLTLSVAREKLKVRYAQALTTMAMTTADEVWAIFANALCQAVDPASAYFAAPTTALPVTPDLNHEGIGMVLETDGVHTRVSHLVEAGPAQNSGRIAVSDVLQSVTDTDGSFHDVVAMRLDDVVRLIRGPRDSQLTLGLRRETPSGEKQWQVVLKREKVVLTAQAVQSQLLAHPIDSGSKLAYIRIPKLYRDFSAAAAGQSDYASATRDVRQALAMANAAGAKGLLLDLRGNGGGALAEVATLVDLFIDRGPVLQERNTYSQVSLLRAEQSGMEWSGAVVVMTDAETAAGAEMLAAALQDYGRAVIVGQPSHGVATVQSVVDLNRYRDGRSGPDFGMLKMTIIKSYRVSGKSFQLEGVTPDVTLTAPTDRTIVRERDKKYALANESIPAAPFEPSSAAVTSLLAELRQRHQTRVDKSKSTDASAAAYDDDAAIGSALGVLVDLLRLQSGSAN